jgi:hypothetical protein
MNRIQKATLVISIAAIVISLVTLAIIIVKW